MKKKFYFKNKLLLVLFFIATGTGAFAQLKVGLNPTTISSSAILDLESTDKGLLIPRVALTGYTDQTTISSPSTSLMVYNLGTGALTFKGFVFWNGTEWRSINNSSLNSPSIITFNCGDSSIFPSNFTSGTAYSGSLTVPYNGGNGGIYSSGTSLSQNGLTFTLNPGSLNIGNGSISYSVSGTPDFSSPNTVSVPINFLSFSCSVLIGSSVSVNSLQYLKKVISPIPTSSDANVQNATKTTFGNLSVRYGGLVANFANSGNSIQLSPSITSQMTVWGELTGGGGSATYTQQSQVTLSANNWTGWNLTFNPFNRDQGRMLVSLHATGEIYRISMLCNDTLLSPSVPSNISFFIEKL